MAWNGAGVFSLLYSWVSRRDAGSPTNLIGATEMDAEMANLKSGLENCIARDGQNAASAALPMGGYNHTGVGAATARTQYARLAEAQDGTIHKAASPGGTIDAMTGTLAPAITAYVPGMLISIIAPGSASNTVTTPTLNVNAVGNMTIQKHQGALVVGDYTAGDPLLFLVLDTTHCELLNPKNAQTVAPPAHSTFTTDATGGDVADYLPIIDASETNADNKTLISDVLTNALATMTAKTTPIAADTVMIGDSAASGAVKSASWTNVFTNLLAVFTAKSAPVLADTLMIADSAASGAPKISTIQQVLNNFNNLTAKTSIVDADTLPMADSAASNVAKKITWANFKTQIQTDLKGSQANMEAAGNAAVFATPGNMVWHPGVSKVLGAVSISGGTNTLQNSYNLTSQTDSGSGLITWTYATAFSSAYPSIFAMTQRITTNDALWTAIRNASGFTLVSSSVLMASVSDGAATSDGAFTNFGAFGDLP